MSSLDGTCATGLRMPTSVIPRMSTGQPTHPCLVMTSMISKQDRQLQEKPEEGAHCRVIHELPRKVEP
eukprot:4484015-Amphidinium_carterae.1